MGPDAGLGVGSVLSPNSDMPELWSLLQFSNASVEARDDVDQQADGVGDLVTWPLLGGTKDKLG